MEKYKKINLFLDLAVAGIFLYAAIYLVPYAIFAQLAFSGIMSVALIAVMYSVFVLTYSYIITMITPKMALKLM